MSQEGEWFLAGVLDGIADGALCPSGHNHLHTCSLNCPFSDANGLTHYLFHR